MAIFVTGDTHGGGSRTYFPDGYLHRFSIRNFPEQTELTKNDFVVICGDFGGVWNTNRLAMKESDAEKYELDWLESKPFTTLFVPGNHENQDRLYRLPHDAPQGHGARFRPLAEVQEPVSQSLREDDREQRW